MTLMTMPDSGPNSNDVKYFKMNSIVQGRGPNRLKYLDLEGRWVLSGKSMSYISTAFNHLEKLNHSQVPLKEITDEPLNAIGMQHWTSSSEPAKTEKKTPPKLVKPSVFVENEVPPSPRENMPHRSAGYGLAHQKRKLSIPDRSRSVSPHSIESSAPEFDKYAKYERNRKDSITRYGTKWGDQSYQSASASPTDHLYKDELQVTTKNSKKTYVPYRTGGYGAYHERRQYDLSPRSTGSTGDYTSGSEQSSPASVHEKNADEILMMTYHLRKIETIPRIYKANYNKY